MSPRQEISITVVHNISKMVLKFWWHHKKGVVMLQYSDAGWQQLSGDITSHQAYDNKANLKDLIAATGLVILLKLD